MRTEHERHRLIHGRIGVRAVFGLAWPIVVAKLSYTLMGIADTIFVGRLGTVEVAAVGLASVVGFVAIAFGGGLMRGARVLVAQLIGAGKESEAQVSAVQAFWLAGAVAIPVMLASLAAGPALALVGAEPEVAAAGATYLSIFLLGAPFTFGAMAAKAWYQGRGDTRTPMVASVGANLLNIGLNAVLVFGLGPIPALGVAGAAIATVISEGVGVGYLALRLRQSLRGVSPRPRAAALRRLWSLGAPLGLRGVAEVGGYVIFAGILASIGSVHLAAHVIVIRIVSVSFLPGLAIGDAAAVIAGQSMGAERPQSAREAHRAGLTMATALMVLWGLAFVMIPGPLLAVFGAEPAVVAVAKELLLVAAAFQLFDAVAIISQSVLSGLGRTRFVMVVGIGVGWLIKLPVAYGLAVSAGYGAVGAWIGLSFEIGVVAVFCMVRLHRDRWFSGPMAPSRA